MVPEGWELSALCDLTKEKISYGIVQAGPHVEGGVPYIKSSNVRGGIKLTSLQRTSEEIHYKYRRSSVHPGDIVFSLRGNIGQAAILPKEIPEANLTQGTARISTNEENDKWFVYYQVTSIPVLNKINSLSKGSTFKEISLAELRKVKILAPPIKEQNKIAKILTTWDKAITTTEKLLANSQQQKKALMQQLLTGKKRFEGFEDSWKNVRLSEVAEMNSGGTPKSTIADYYDGVIPWVSIADMTEHGKFIVKTKKNITALGVDNSSARIYPVNTVLYAMYASIGECSIAKVELSSSQAILGIRPKSKLEYMYLYYYLSSLKEKIKLQGQQGTQSNLNAGMVKGFRFYLPSREEQKKIAHVLKKSINAAIINRQATSQSGFKIKDNKNDR